MSKKEIKLMNRLKINCLNLRVNYQIPLKLAVLINSLDNQASDKEIKFLMELSKHYMRVKGYYKEFPYLDKQYSSEIKESYIKFKGQIL